MSYLYTPSTQMCDIISDEPTLLQMMSRFGIPLGVGEASVHEICEQNGVDTLTFLAVANFMKHSEVPATSLDKVSPRALMTYLRQSHDYFLHFQLPGIRRRLLDAIDTSRQNEVAYLILKFYDDFMNEVRRHMENENSKIFGYVDKLLQGETSANFSIHQYARNHVGMDRKMQELKNSLIKYHTPQCDKAPLLADVLLDIFHCERDLRLHCHLEDQLFIPVVERLETSVEEQSAHQASPSPKQPTNNLSEREREVIKCIVRGMSNKETAEHLFISIHTVLTHRKNIARKLNIHSAAGLTIYAIANAIVSLDELQIS